MTARAVIADPRPLIREALTAALAVIGVDVIHAAADADELVNMTAEHQPDLVIADHRLLDTASGEVADTIRGEHGAQMLLIGRRPDQVELVRALECGADGFLSPSAPLDEIRRAIARIATGEAYIPPRMLSGLLRELINRRRDEDGVLQRFSRLSRREREVLRLIVDGATQQEMAAALFLSPHTVRTHVQNVIEKLGVHSRVEAASVAVEYDLLGRFADEEAADG